MTQTDSTGSRRRPIINGVLDRLIIGVEGRFEEEDRSDAAGDVHYLARFVGC